LLYICRWIKRHDLVPLQFLQTQHVPCLRISQLSVRRIPLLRFRILRPNCQQGRCYVCNLLAPHPLHLWCFVSKLPRWLLRLSLPADLDCRMLYTLRKPQTNLRLAQNVRYRIVSFQWHHDDLVILLVPYFLLQLHDLLEVPRLHDV